MTLGLAKRQGGLCNAAVQRREAELPERSIYLLLHAERNRLGPDELSNDRYLQRGRRSVPPAILALVGDPGDGNGAAAPRGLLGPGSRGPVHYDLRWRYAAGGDNETPVFIHTVVVELRARLCPSPIGIGSSGSPPSWPARPA